MSHVFAFTDATQVPYPSYVSVNTGPRDTMSVTARTEGNQGKASGRCILEKSEAIDMARAILRHYNEE